MTKEEIQKRLTEVDALLRKRAIFLACLCTPYDMDKEYVALVAEEKELEEELRKLV